MLRGRRRCCPVGCACPCPLPPISSSQCPRQTGAPHPHLRGLWEKTVHSPRWFVMKNMWERARVCVCARARAWYQPCQQLLHTQGKMYCTSSQTMERLSLLALNLLYERQQVTSPGRGFFICPMNSNKKTIKFLIQLWSLLKTFSSKRKISHATHQGTDTKFYSFSLFF